MARRKKADILNIDKAIKEVLEEYGDDVYEVLGEAVDQVADEGVKKLESVRRFSRKGNPTGEYSRDWVADVEPVGRLGQKRVIHNLEHYRLAHLLEKGHVSRNGTGRVFDPVPAYPHIKPVEEWVQEELPKRVEEMIKAL